MGEFKSGLIEAISDAEYDAIEKLAHKMCGSAGNFGLESLCLVLSTIETEARGRNQIPETLRQRFEIAYDEAITALKAFLAEEKPADLETGIRASR